MEKIIDFLYEIALNNLAYFDSIASNYASIAPKLDVIVEGLFVPIIFVILGVLSLVLLFFLYIEIFKSSK